MGSVYETKKRLAIARDIAEQIKDAVQVIVLGGSMGYGQNFSITTESDIDMVVVCDSKQLRELLAREYFETFELEEPAGLIEQGNVGFFWVTKIIEGVEVNMFIYEIKAYENYCLFKEKIVGYRPGGTKTNGKGYLFDGTLIEFDQNVTKIGKGYTYEKPALFKEKYWDAVPRHDFINSYFLIHDPVDFWKELDKKFWREVVLLLTAEYGENPNLEKVGPLQAHWIYQTAPERLPPGFEEKVVERTRKEFNALQTDS